MSEPIKIFITGGTGFIGKHLLKKLQAWSASNVIMYVLVRNGAVFADSRIVPVRGDLRTIDEQADIIRSCDYVFHLAANVNFFGGKNADDKVNFESTRRIIELLTSAPNRLKNFVFVSTIGAVDRHKNDTFATALTTASTPAPTTLYGRSKLKSEACVKESGLPFTIIRPTWVYGEHMRPNSHINKFVSLVYSRVPIFRLNFPGRVSMIHVGDLVGAMAACIGSQAVIGKTYFAATEAHSIGAIFKIIFKEITGQELRQIGVPRFLQSLVRKIHTHIPLTVANLFVDYLYADGAAFTNDFAIARPVQFAEAVGEVVASNASLFKQVTKYKAIGFGWFGAWLKMSLYPMAFLKEIVPERGTVLDLGCGEGMLTNLLAQALPGVQMIGVDKDAARIAQAKKVALPRTQFWCRSIEEVDIASVSGVIVNDVLHHHSPDTQRLLIKKILNSIGPRGFLLIKEVDRGDWPDRLWTSFWDRLLYPKDALHFRTPAEWTALLKEFGYELAASHRVAHFWPASRTILVYKKYEN